MERYSQHSSLSGHQGRGQDEYEAQIPRRRLLSVRAAGSFATGNVLDSCPSPGICLDGGEQIDVPLLAEAAQNLASKSDNGPFGNHEKGSRKTRVNKTVRKTLQISGERISFRNPQWNGFVNKLVQRVAHELGVPPTPNGSNVRAELYEHLIYGPGTTFKPHKGSEKIPGMFGTLVICLPSKHMGGTICLQHGKDSVELSTAETSADRSYYLAWHADVTHKVKPIQTGYRWVLVYNLIIDSERSGPSALVLDSQIRSLVEPLSLWEMLKYPPDSLVYPPNHQYTPGSMRLSSLKGLDHQRARCLADSCHPHGEFYLFLCQFDRFQSCSNDDGRESNKTRRIYLHHVCSLEGCELSPFEVDVYKTSLLDSINFQSNPVFRGGGEYVGNSNADKEEIYEDIVLVLVRADSHHTLYMNSGSPYDVDKVMRQLQACINYESINDNTKTTLQKLLSRLCRIILDQRSAAKEANDVFLGYVAVATVFLGDWPLFEEARKKTLRAWDDQSWFALGGLIDLPNSPVNVDDIFGSLMKRGTFYNVYQGLTNFYNGFRGDNVGRETPAKAEYWKQWYSDKLIDTLDMCDICRGEDAGTIRQILWGLKIEYTPEQRNKLDEAVTNFVDRFTGVKGFVNALNVELLLELSNPENVRKEFLLELFGSISEFAISSFDFDLFHAYVKRLRYTNTDGLIRDFYTRVLVHDEDSASNLLRQLSRKAWNAKEDTVREVLVPLMKELLPCVNTGLVEVQTCFKSLVEVCFNKTVRRESSKPEEWARSEEIHECYGRSQTCPELNAFLKDLEAKGKNIAVTANLQKHVRWHFDLLEKGNGSDEGEVHYTKTLKGREDRHRYWESDVKAAQEKLQELPRYVSKEALGDKYNALMALTLIRINKSTAQAPDKAQPPLPSKRPRDTDANDTAPETSSKCARRGENIEG